MDQKQIREIHEITVRIDTALKLDHEYRVLTWSQVGSYGATQTGLNQCLKHIDIIEKNLVALERLAGSRKWTDLEKSVLRVFYRANMRLVVQAEDARRNICDFLGRQAYLLGTEPGAGEGSTDFSYD